jgi:hypothetical protein
MATGLALETLVVDLRAELRQSVSPAHGANALSSDKVILRRVQEQLWLDHAWPHLRVQRDVSLAAGQRYYDFPDDLDLMRVERVCVRWSGIWHDLQRGIGPEQYNAFNSDAGIRADPVWRWRPWEETQFEVWPIPVADDLQVLRFDGIRSLNPLVDDADTCDLDGRLIVLVAAAELAADTKSPRAQGLAQSAKAYLQRLKQRGEFNDGGRFSLGGAAGDQPLRGKRLAPPLVAVDRG